MYKYGVEKEDEDFKKNVRKKKVKGVKSKKKKIKKETK